LLIVALSGSILLPEGLSLASEQPSNISAYFPTPYGVYRQLKIDPVDHSIIAGAECAAGEGTLAYQDNALGGERGLYVCAYDASNSKITWQKLSGSVVAAGDLQENAGDPKAAGAPAEGGGNIRLIAGSNILWGADDITSSGSYGVRDDGGKLMYKNSGGAWSPIGGINCNVRTAISSKSNLPARATTATAICKEGEFAVSGGFNNIDNAVKFLVSSSRPEAPAPGSANGWGWTASAHMAGNKRIQVYAVCCEGAGVNSH